MISSLSRKQKFNLKRIAAAIALVVISKILEGKIEFVPEILFLAAYVVVGYDILKKAWRNIRKGRALDENFLMAFASLGVIILGLTGYCEMDDGCYVMILYQIGELFESVAVGKSRRNISELIDIRPDYANVERENGDIERVNPAALPLGSIILVKPGEKVPIDGVIVEGSTALDTAALTGESRMRDVTEGSEILSGCINMISPIKIRTTRLFTESTASRILDLVENASSRKSKSEDFITKFARVYTPAVCGCALALALLAPAISLLAGGQAQWRHWLYVAFTFLVISCPCALVISIPLSFFGGLGGASKAGILIKGSNFMEPLSRCRTVVFDKTGTMTKGVLEVCAVHHSPIDEKELIEYASCAECFSSHPVSLALQRKYGRVPDSTRVKDVREISGEGIIAAVDGKTVGCGNEKLMERLNVKHICCEGDEDLGTVVHVSIDGQYCGHLIVADEIKPNAAEAIEKMRKVGVRRTVMLTGDTENVARGVARELGIDEIHASLLPGDKVGYVEKFLEEKSARESLSFVGDGINDAPVLSRADVGIAMGAIGSDAAIEAADVVIMDDDPMKIAKGIKIARKCMAIVYENIVFAIGVKIACMVVTVFLFQSMKLAEFADVGVLILAILNAVRAMNVKKL